MNLFRPVIILTFIALTLGGWVGRDAIAQTDEGPASTVEEEYVPEDGDASDATDKEAVPEKPTRELTAAEIREMAKQYARERIDATDYAEPSYENLAKLYWGLGMFDPDHDYEAVNQYLLINECEIYNNYFNDDFEWKKIHSATVEFLKNNRRDFPKRFQFTRAIELGRYDFQKQAFYVVDQDLNAGARIYEMNQTQASDTVCGILGTLNGYPRDLHLILSRPFKLTFLPVGEDAAQDFIARTTHANYEDLMKYGKAYQRSSYSRIAFLNIRVRVIKYQGTVRTGYGRDAAQVFAVLEGYDVWEDPKGKRVIFSTRNQQSE